MKFLGIAGAVPGAYSAEQTAETARELQRQKALMEAAQIATMQRQAPLQDQLIRAKIAHLQRPSQFQLDAGGNEALLKFLAQSGQATPMPQQPQAARPDPFATAQQPLGVSPGVSGAWSSPGGGQLFALPNAPQVNQSVGVTMPQGFTASPGGNGGLPAMPLPPQVQQPSPLQGAGPMPSAQPQAPLSPQQQYQAVLAYAQTIQNPMQRQAFVGAALQHIQQQQQEQLRAMQQARQEKQALETERAHRETETQRDYRAAVSEFNTQSAAVLRNDIAYPTKEDKAAEINRIGRDLGIKGYVDKEMPDQDKDALRQMMRSKMGLGPNDPIDLNQAQAAGIFGTVFQLPSGQKYVLYRDQNGPHWEPVK